MDKEERRNRALRGGKKYEYFVCPLCFLNRPTHRIGKGRSNFDSFDPKTNHFVQIRKGVGGQGMGGFYTDESSSLTLHQALKDDAYSSVIQEIHGQCKKLMEFIEHEKNNQ
ncbi:MAG: hypothetical protein Q8O68_00620 [Candidatus Daviesbacteria bacterium]|nr:hypothetical protein [Candidatus Daviesbacteria bacterium]